MTFSHDTIEQIIKLTGQNPSDNYTKNESYQKLKNSLENCNLFNNNDIEYKQNGIGYSQFNELLLTLDYDRVTKDFFVWLFGEEAVIANFESLEKGVEKFRKTAMLLYGNIKYAFKNLARMKRAEIVEELKIVEPLSESHYTKRHKPLHKLKKIYAHYQAAAQCEIFLSSLPDCKVEYFKDTAMSVKKIKEEGIKHHAAIASEEAAQLFNVKIIKNSTRTANII